MFKQIGLADRLANRLARALPRPKMLIEPQRPIVSFTFDDVPETALSNGARILEQFGVRGTFYTAGGLSGRVHDGQPMLADDGYRELASRGHELGHHTFSHRSPVRLAGRYRDDLDRNDAFLTRVTDGYAKNFAFPYGLTSPAAQRAVDRRFRSGRSVLPGINRGPADPGFLLSVEIGGRSEPEPLLGWIDDVVAAPGWLIYFTHDVKDPPSRYGCPPDLLERLVGHALETGCEVLTVDAALDRLEAGL
jgi:peptidoglycan/xylan/chitin deacetylase (PgdA/CDA1 family)